MQPRLTKTGRQAALGGHVEIRRCLGRRGQPHIARFLGRKVTSRLVCLGHRTRRGSIVTSLPTYLTYSKYLPALRPSPVAASAPSLLSHPPPSWKPPHSHWHTAVKRRRKPPRPIQTATPGASKWIQQSTRTLRARLAVVLPSSRSSRSSSLLSINAFTRRVSLVAGGRSNATWEALTALETLLVSARPEEPQEQSLRILSRRTMQTRE